jgi:hypothetical protein
MESKTFMDARGRSVKVEVNMGSEVDISLDFKIEKMFKCGVYSLSLRSLQDILDFCQEYLAAPQVSRQGSTITERSITFSYQLSYEDWEQDKKMILVAVFDGTLLSLKNAFPDADGRTFYSEVKYLLLDSLRQALAFAQQCKALLHHPGRSTLEAARLAGQAEDWRSSFAIMPLGDNQYVYGEESEALPTELVLERWLRTEEGWRQVFIEEAKDAR